FSQMATNHQPTLAAAKQLQQHIPTFYLSVPGALRNYVQYLYQSPLFTLIRFGKWEEILNEKVDDSLSYTPVLQHFARGMAFAKTDRLNEAQKELGLMKVSIGKPSLKEPLAPFNSAYDASVVAENILGG